MPHKRGAKWIAKIVVDGDQRWLGTFKTKKAALDAEAQERKTAGRLKASTCDAFAHAWTTRYPRPKKSTDTTNAERVSKFAADFADVELRNVDRPQAREWALANPGRVPAVRAMFTDAMNDGYCHTNPFAGLRIAIRQHREVEPLTVTELDALVDVARRIGGPAHGPVFAAQIVFSAYVGLRPGELFPRVRADITGELLRIDTQLNHRTGQIDVPKNWQPRTVVCPPQAREAALALPARMDGLLFWTVRGKPMNEGNLTYAWRPVRERFNAEMGRDRIDDYYDLRHFCGSHLANLGVHERDIAYQLGHADGGVTARRHYIHTYDDDTQQRLLAAYRRRVVPIRPAQGGRRAAENK